ncbi:hypothetical protein MMC07_001602 [Pseudocyphellaria aurata]|nr:hypothetical protein [Pseudocyphellaria aurata]
MAEFDLSPEDEKFLVPIPTTSLDTRSDDEIVHILRAHHPVISERNIWAFWDKGFDAMAPWCRRNVLAWVRRHDPTWTVRVLDAIPDSPNYMYKFIGPENFPPAVNEGTITGSYKGQHVSDLVRLAVLYLHGGVYIDVSTVLFRRLEDICWAAIEDPSSPYEVGGFAYQSRTYFGQMFNGFIASRKNNPFVKRWHEVFVEMWRERTDVTGIHSHPLVRHLGVLQPYDPCFGLNPDHRAFSDYCAQFLAYERVRLAREPGSEDAFDGPAYFRKHFFLLESWEEAFRSQDVLEGRVLHELLKLERRPDAVSTDEQQRQAQTLAHDLMARSAVAKFGQGYWRLGMPMALSGVWALPGNQDDDCIPGTWGAFVRYGSVHLDQKRHMGTFLPPIEIPEEKDVVVVARHLEPVQ